jgi:phosphatidylserine synthase
VVVFFTTRRWMEAAAGPYGDALLYAACGALVVCGILRLARFCYLSGGHSSTFIGLPSPGSALVLALLTLQGMYSTAPLSPGFRVAAAFVLAGLMISELRYPKVRGAYAVVSGIVIFLVMLTERFEGTRLASEFMLDVGLLLALAYVALGPLAVRRRSRRPHDGQG